LNRDFENRPARTWIKNHPFKKAFLLIIRAAVPGRFLLASLIFVSILFMGIAGWVSSKGSEQAGIPAVSSNSAEGVFRPLANKAYAGALKEPDASPSPAEASQSESSIRTKEEWIRLRLVTYNVHKCQGLDRLTLPGRIASVLKNLNPDIVALQEIVGAGPRGRGQEEEIGEILRMRPLLEPALLLRGHPYGNALLSRFPIKNHAACDLSQKNLEPRFCQRVDLLIDGHPVHLYNVHLGTSWKERERQAKQLASFLSDPSVKGPKILLGDFNEWFKGPATQTLCETFQSLDIRPFLKWPKTYPGFLPVFQIDQMYYKGPVQIVKVEAPRNWSTMIASDHMPLVAELKIRVDGEASQ
jgi:endonuclease/exonuclease/phosphatase family metal-dependent hydrolase